MANSHPSGEDYPRVSDSPKEPSLEEGSVIPFVSPAERRGLEEFSGFLDELAELTWRGLEIRKKYEHSSPEMIHALNVVLHRMAWVHEAGEKGCLIAKARSESRGEVEP